MRTDCSVPGKIRLLGSAIVSRSSPGTESRSLAERLLLAERERDRALERLETERRSLEAARETDRRKDEFLAMLSHELRSPLAPIRTALHLIRAKVDGKLDREIALIDRQVSHLTRLVDDLLDLSRVASGKIQLEREPLDLTSVIAKAIDLAGPLIEQRRHRLVVDVAHHAALKGDATRLAQVFGNILTNAAKYTDAGGRIEIIARLTGRSVEVTIRDNGVGIPPEVLPYVFDRFVQAQQSPERTQGGLGVGLALVKSLVELHGGAVSGHSDGPGCGSAFRVVLPLAGIDAPPVRHD